MTFRNNTWRSAETGPARIGPAGIGPSRIGQQGKRPGGTGFLNKSQNLNDNNETKDRFFNKTGLKRNISVKIIIYLDIVYCSFSFS